MNERAQGQGVGLVDGMPIPTDVEGGSALPGPERRRPLRAQQLTEQQQMGGNALRGAYSIPNMDEWYSRPPASDLDDSLLGGGTHLVRDELPDII